MPYLILEDFKGGVDRRRPRYSGKPGTLWNGKNVHLSMGGDIEVRPGFIDQGTFGSDTFGLFPVGNVLYTFGSAATATTPSGVIYQRLSYPGGAMTEFIDADLFDGKIYAIARFGDGSVQHFYDGVLVADWNDGIVRPYMGNLIGVATALAALIDASASYVATSALNVITVTAAVAGTPFTVTTFAENGGAVDDETMVDANTTANVVGVSGVQATFGFPVRGGTGAGSLSALLVGGVSVISGAINWATDNATFAAAIAADITAFASSPKYNATATGEGVLISAALNGVAANGLSVVATTTGTASVDGQTAAGGPTIIGTMSGGVAAVTAVAQVNTLTLGGTFDPGDRFGVTLASGSPVAVSEYFGNVGKPFGNATCVRTHKRKVYAGAGSILFFCGVNAPVGWNSDFDAGAGFIPASNHVGGSEVVSSLEPYQGRLGVFSRSAVQLWTMQADDLENNPDQFLLNTGTRSPRSSLEFAGNDVFYLDDMGIRSLRARDASNNAFASGVGAAINPLIRSWMRDGASQDDIERAVAFVEPVWGRFWIAIGTRIFVYSFFPDTGISAWSWYDVDFTITDAARTFNKAWVRGSDNRLYLFGGDSGEEYDDDIDVAIGLPFTTAKKPGTFKQWLGMDMAAAGSWNCQLLIDPRQEAFTVQMGVNDGVTFSMPGWDAVGDSTHIAPEFTFDAGEDQVNGTTNPSRSLSEIALYYAGSEESN